MRRSRSGRVHALVDLVDRSLARAARAFRPSVGYHGCVTYRQFREAVETMLDEIPEAFLQELQGVHVLEQEKPEEGYDDVWRMGEYLDPGPEDFLHGEDGLGRHIALYHGSFARIAENDPAFDWEAEIWETLTHELQHHVESLAGDGRLIEQDLIDAASFPQPGDPEHDDESTR